MVVMVGMTSKFDFGLISDPQAVFVLLSICDTFVMALNTTYLTALCLIYPFTDLRRSVTISHLKVLWGGFLHSNE